MNLKIKKYLIVLSPLVLFFILIKFSFLLNFFHHLINIFAGGRSFTKVFAYLLYLFLLLIIAYLLKYQKISFNFRKKIIFLIFLGSAYLVNFFSYLYFFIKYKFSYQDYVLVFNAQELSSTQFLHNHTLKSIVAWVLNFFNITYLENIDAGGAFLNIIPHIFIIIGLILFLVVLFFFIYYFCHKIKLITENQFIYTILYSVLSFSLLKNIIDGGFLNYEALVSFSFFILLLFADKKWSQKVTISLVYFYLFLNMILNFLGFFSGSKAFFYNIYYIMLYSLLLTIFFYALGKNKVKRTLILFIILEISLATFYFISFFNMNDYRNIEILKDDRVLVATYGILERENYDFYTSINNLYFYEASFSENKKNKDILEELNLLDNFYPVSVYWKTCNPRGLAHHYSFKLLTDQEFEVHNFEKAINFLDFNLIGQRSGMYEYKVELNMGPCLPRPTNVIEEVFKSLGLNKFFIYQLHIDSNGGPII
jgi:hypothetical protein